MENINRHNTGNISITTTKKEKKYINFSILTWERPQSHQAPKQIQVLYYLVQ